MSDRFPVAIDLISVVKERFRPFEGGMTVFLFAVHIIDARVLAGRVSLVRAQGAASGVGGGKGGLMPEREAA